MFSIKSLSIRNLFFVLLLGTVIAATTSFVSPQKTQAYSGGLDCVGTSAGNFNLVVFTRVQDSQGRWADANDLRDLGLPTNLVDGDGFSNYFQFTIQSYKNANATYAERVEYDKWRFNSILYRNDGSASPRGDSAHTMTVRRQTNNNTNSQTAMYDRQGNICQTSDGGMRAAYAFRDGDQTRLNCFPTAAGKTRTGCGTNADADRPERDNNYSWILSCLASDATAYVVSAPRLPGVAGGSWVTHPVYQADDTGGVFNINWTGGTRVNFYTDTGYEVNNRERKIVFVYRLPAPPPPASATPSVKITPTTIDEGSQYTATASIKNNNPTGVSVTGGTWQVWLDEGSKTYGAGDSALFASPVTPNPGPPVGPIAGNGTISRSFTGTATAGYRFVCSRLFNLTGSVGLTFSPADTGAICIPIARFPYFEVQNGDINTTCGSGGDISAYWNETIGNGSGAQGAVFAGGTVSGFASRLLNVGNPLMPNSLTLSNMLDGSEGAGVYGKELGSDVGCSGDAEIPAGVGGTTTISNIAAAKADATRMRNGVYYVNGDLTISNNLFYDVSPGSFSLTGVPRFKVVVSGNIYILPNVQEINGSFTAGGTIFTCSDGTSDPTAMLANPASQCYSNPLTVYGVLEADTVKFLRLRGSAGSVNSAGETIIYDPLVWIYGASPSSSGGSGGKFDAYTTMPPIL